MFQAVMERFSQQAPAALLFRGMVAWVFSDERLEEIFRQFKERQVESELLFSTMIRLLTRVVVGSKRSVNAAFVDMKQEVGVSSQALYDKLSGVELPVSEALVRVPVESLMKIVKRTRIIYDDPIPGYRTYVIDGKRLDGTEHRLKETRSITNAPLPGTGVAVLDMQHRLFVDIALDEDAHACERKVLKRMIPRLEKGALYIQDRNFSDGPLIDQYCKAKAYFLVRQHRRSPVWQATGPLENKGVDARGGKVSEQASQVKLPDGSWKAVRRVVIKLATPTRNKDKEISVLTNLPPKVTAVQIANGYAKRWTVETCLGHLAQALKAEINTLAYPRAALVGFAVGLVVFNIISTLQTLLLKYARCQEKPKLSKYYLACEIAETMRGLEIMTDQADWRRVARMTFNQFYQWAKRIAQRAQLQKYKSTTRGPKRSPPTRRTINNSTHISTYKILQQRSNC